MTATVDLSSVSTARTHALGAVCAVAGVLGAASGLLLLVVPPAVPEDVFSHPLDTGPFAAIQVWFFVQHLGLVAGIVAAGTLAPGSRLARTGVAVSAAGMLLLAATELWAIGQASATYPSDATDPLDTAYGTASLACGVGLVLLGVAVLRSGRVAGWRRWVPLATGVWVFVPMTPMIISGFVGGRLGIVGWMLLFALLGWTIARGPVDGQRATGAASTPS